MSGPGGPVPKHLLLLSFAKLFFFHDLNHHQVTPRVRLRNDYSNAQKDICRPLRKHKIVSPCPLLHLFCSATFNCHHSFLIRWSSSVRSHGQVPMSLQVFGLPDWPVSACFLPSPPSPAAHKIQAQISRQHIIAKPSRAPSRSCIRAG